MINTRPMFSLPVDIYYSKFSNIPAYNTPKDALRNCLLLTLPFIYLLLGIFKYILVMHFPFLFWAKCFKKSLTKSCIFVLCVMRI